MSVLYDTSSLVAALLELHPRHAWARTQIDRTRTPNFTALISTHSIAELFSVLTRHPQAQVPPRLAAEAIERALTRFEVVELNREDYRLAVQRLGELGIQGGAIFDALIAEAALKAQVDELITLNPKHFLRLGERISRLVRAPDEKS